MKKMPITGEPMPNFFSVLDFSFFSAPFLTGGGGGGRPATIFLLKSLRFLKM